MSQDLSNYPKHVPCLPYVSLFTASGSVSHCTETCWYINLLGPVRYDTHGTTSSAPLIRQLLAAFWSTINGASIDSFPPAIDPYHHSHADPSSLRICILHVLCTNDTQSFPVIHTDYKKGLVHSLRHIHLQRPISKPPANMSKLVSYLAINVHSLNWAHQKIFTLPPADDLKSIYKTLNPSHGNSTNWICCDPTHQVNTIFFVWISNDPLAESSNCTGIKIKASFRKAFELFHEYLYIASPCFLLSVYLIRGFGEQHDISSTCSSTPCNTSSLQAMAYYTNLFVSTWKMLLFSLNQRKAFERLAFSFR